MIDFKEKRFGYKSIGKEDEEMLELRSADILKDLEERNKTKNPLFRAVCLPKGIYRAGWKV